MDKKYVYGIVIVLLISGMIAYQYIEDHKKCTGITTYDLKPFNVLKKDAKKFKILEEYPETIQKEAIKNKGIVNTNKGILNLSDTVFRLRCE